MTIEEVIGQLEDAKCGYQEYLSEEAINMATQALEQISYLTDRPCEVCKFHTEEGCSKWKCVFEGSEQ